MSAESDASPHSTGELHLEAIDGQRLRLHLRGEWRLRDSLPSSADAEESILQSQARSVEFDTTELSGWDSALLAFLVRLHKLCTERNVALDPDGLPEGARELLRLAFAVPEQQGTGRDAAPASRLSRVGERVLEGLAGARETLEFVGEALQSLGRFVTGRARYRSADFWLFVQHSGADALPIVSLISFLVGLILAFVGVQQLKIFGAEIYAANLVGIAMAREMGCIMTGIIMAGRTGAAFAAQLGTMNVNEEIDALRTLGIPPIDFLVLPRMLALILMMPLLCLYANLVGIVGGGLIAVAGSDITAAQYTQQTIEGLALRHIVIGVTKASFFGVLVALAGCLRGMQCGRSASAVGAATTSAVVLGIIWIIAWDAVFAVALDSLGW